MHKNDLSPLKATYLSDDPVSIMVFSQYQKSTRACTGTHGRGREIDNLLCMALRKPMLGLQVSQSYNNKSC